MLLEERLKMQISSAIDLQDPGQTLPIVLLMQAECSFVDTLWVAGLQFLQQLETKTFLKPRLVLTLLLLFIKMQL